MMSSELEICELDDFRRISSEVLWNFWCFGISSETYITVALVGTASVKFAELLQLKIYRSLVNWY
jgi:hypothetical protein